MRPDLKKKETRNKKKTKQEHHDAAVAKLNMRIIYIPTRNITNKRRLVKETNLTVLEYEQGVGVNTGLPGRAWFAGTPREL